MNENKLIYAYTKRRLEYLAENRSSGAGKGILANLRHGAGKAPGELPELWGVVFDGKFPEELMGGRDPSRAEWAIYTALTLYALHMQGADADMNKENVSLGEAAAGLVKTAEDRERAEKRLGVVATAVSPEDAAYHLRTLVRMLGDENIPMDYAKLAEQLYWFYSPEAASKIKLSWGRDFYRKLNRNEGVNNNE